MTKNMTDEDDEDDFANDFANAGKIIAAAYRRVRADTLAEVEAIIIAQPFFPDTHTGMRQQWLKNELLTKVRMMKDGEA